MMKLQTFLFCAVAAIGTGCATATAAISGAEVAGIHGTISLLPNVVAVNTHQRAGDSVTLNPQPLPPKILVLGGEATINAQALAHLAPGTACNALVVSARMADGSVRSTQASGVASSGRCNYDLPIHNPGPVTEITITSANKNVMQLHVRGSSLAGQPKQGGTVNFVASH